MTVENLDHKLFDHKLFDIYGLLIRQACATRELPNDGFGGKSSPSTESSGGSDTHAAFYFSSTPALPRDQRTVCWPQCAKLSMPPR